MIPAREIDYLSLKLLMERSDGTSLKKAHEIKRITHAWRKGWLFIPPQETEQQKWWRCEARMMLGYYADWSGWEYRDEWAATLWHHHKEVYAPVQPWNGVHTPCLYVIGEQGIGDEVIFSSCIPDALKLTDRLILECQPKMRGVFERAFGVETVSANLKGTRRYKQDLPKEVTAWMSLGDLPRMWRTHLKHFPGTPYLQALPDQVERFRRYRGRTGISWRGRQGEEKDLLRLFPDAVSLQYDMEWDEDVERPDLDLRDDIEGVLGLIANLDRVVAVSTTAAHMAAALGIPTDVVIADRHTSKSANQFPFKWLCGDSGRTPWYSCVRSYQNINEYRSHRSRSIPKGKELGGGDRPTHGHKAQEPQLAA